MMNDQHQEQLNSVARYNGNVFKKTIALFLLGFGAACLVFGIKFVNEHDRPTLLSPVDFNTFEAPTISTSSTGIQPQSAKQKVIYGFLPYWTIKTATLDSSLTHIGYFSLPIDRNGNFVTSTDDAATGWKTFRTDAVERVRQETTKNNQKFEVLITMMDADDIASFLRNGKAQDTFIKNVKTFIKSQPVDGINLDIEYAGDVDDELRNAYTAFISKFSKNMRTSFPSLHISLDIFADSALKYRIWNLPQLAPSVDHIVVMTYDFFRSSSPQSGPVAPLFGSEKNRWDVDIVKTLKPMLDQVPSEKILLGIPFYGYEWQTVGSAPGSNTFPQTGGLATYKRVKKLLEEKNIKEQWDSDAFSPYLTYIDKGNIQTIFYENALSLSYKLDLVRETNMGGIAIWALGYEGSGPELWHVIRQKLR